MMPGSVGGVGVVISIALALGSCSVDRQFSDVSGGEGGEGGDAAGLDGLGTAAGRSDGGRSGRGGGGLSTIGERACADEEYLDRDGCRPLTVCPAGTFVSSEPSADSDRSCEACADGAFSRALNAATCVPWSECQEGESESVPPSAASDRVCSTCGAGKYARGQDCVALTVCTADQYESTPPTATSDRECTDKPVCGTDPERTCTVDCPCPSGEGMCTASNQCEAGASCVAGSGKKVGRDADTCLANHCNSGLRDGDETSVDCGGECGCRATFDGIEVKSLPAGMDSFYPSAMSRDGERLAGAVTKGRLSYPAVMTLDGKVTALENYGREGSTVAASANGNVVLGVLSCANPPSCSDTAATGVTWTGTAAPQVVAPHGGNPRAISSSGTIVVGDYYDSAAGDYLGFYAAAGKNTITIADPMFVRGITPDGQHVVGESTSGGQAKLWSAQTGLVTKIGLTTWSNITIDAINGPDPVVVGSAVVTASGERVGFRWKGGALTELARLGGGAFIDPSGVSTDGGTVVDAAGPAGIQQTFIWTDAGQRRPLVDELRARGLELAEDFSLSAAPFLSDDGKTIVGSFGTTPSSFWRVVLD